MRVLFVQLLELERLVLHQHLALLVLQLLELLDRRLRSRARLLQLPAVLGGEALLLGAVTLLLGLLELKKKMFGGVSFFLYFSGKVSIHDEHGKAPVPPRRRPPSPRGDEG